ncbi:MAG: AAA family ATPase [Nitrososphaerales archaeon]
MLSERVRPTKIGLMIGNEQARLDLVKWLKNWKIGTKPVLLTGPPGVGKSTAVYAIAREFGYTIIEYNASDVRTRDRLREALAPTLENSSVFGGEKLMVFLDEIDGLLGRSDYAGMDYVLDYIENATIPLAMAANMEETQKIKKIEQKSLVLRFTPVGPDLLLIYLRGICSKEGILVSDETLQQVAKNSRGDVRQALNSIQTLSGQVIVGGKTDHQFMSESSALDAIFQAKDLEKALQLMRQFDASPYDKIRAMFDSIVSAKNLSVESRSESLDLVADADMLLGKINREQSWRLLRYFDRYLALAILGKSILRSDSSIPWNLRLAIWNDGKVIRSMTESLSEKYHAGKSDISNIYLPYLATYFKNRPEALEEFLKHNEFEDSERRVIMKLAAKK